MSYHEQASMINTHLKRFFSEINLDGGDDRIKMLIDQMLRFGQVAKFRCRSNSAYDNFCNIVFSDIAELQRIPLREGSDFEVLQATAIKLNK